MKRKLLSILLCLAMALSLLPTAALAEETVTYPAEVQDERELRYALYSAPTNGTKVTIKLANNITLEMLYAAENFGTDKLEDNAAGDTFNRYKRGVHPTAEDSDNWNPLVTDQTEEQRVVYGAYYHMSATDERIARLVVKAGQNIELDLNGHTIQKAARATHGDWSNTCTDIIGNYGTLTVTDTSSTTGTIRGNGYISCNGAVLHNYENAVMTVGKVNIDGNATGMAAGTGQYVISNEGGEVKLNGTNVYDTATSASLLVSTAGTMTITGGATLNHPATKAINAKGGNVTIENATIFSDKYAIFATDNSNVTINSGVTINGTGTVKKDKETATVNNNTGAELPVPAGYEWVEENGKQTLKMNAAVVGGANYPTLDAALAALNAENHTLTLIDDSAWTYDNVYWKAGDQSEYAATLAAALTAAYKAGPSDGITIVCRPGADVGTMTHGHVADNLTIYGNNAYLSGGECDLEVDTYKFNRDTGAQADDGVGLGKDITITAYELDNLGVWGQRTTNHTVTVNLTDCDGREISDQSNNLQRVYISGTSGANNITLTDCDFITAATAVYSNADGSITIDGCSFTGGQAPVNFNHKDEGEQTVTVKNSTFTKCGSTSTNNKLNQYAAPIRFVNSGSGTMNANVSGCDITGTKGTNGDILLGDGRTGEKSNDVTLTVTNTAANVQAQQPGYYAADGTVVAVGKVSKTTVTESQTRTITNSSKAADVGGTKYDTLQEAIDAADGKTVKLLKNVTEAVMIPVDKTITLDLNGFTLVNSETAQHDTVPDANREHTITNNGTLTIEDGVGGGIVDNVSHGRAAIYNAGTITEIKGGKFTRSVDKSTDAASAKGNSWYVIYNAENATINKISGGEFLAIGKFSSLFCNSGTIDEISGGTFTQNGFIAFKNEGTVKKISGGTFSSREQSCIQNWGTIDEVCGGTITAGSIGIWNLSSDKYAAPGKVGVISGGSISGTTAAIRLTDYDNTQDGGNKPSTTCKASASITGGTITGALDVRENTKLTISGGTFDRPIDSKYCASGFVPKANSDGTYGVTRPSSGSSSDPTYSVSTPSKTENGTVTVSPKSASKGDTVTVTVKPDSGYVLETLTVTDKNGNELTLKDKGNGKYTFTMPAGKVEVKATFMEDNSMLNFFYDVPNNAYFYEAVKWAVENGITSGTSATTFSPNASCTRAQMVTFLWRANGSPKATGTNPFTDVSADAYYYDAVLWAAEKGITSGTTATTFSPDAVLTRGQTVTFLWRTNGSPAISGGSFADVDASAYYANAVAWAMSEGITSGTGGNNFSPEAPCTRAQIVTFMYRAD